MERVCDGLWHIDLDKNAAVEQRQQSRRCADGHMVVAIGADV